MKKLTIPLLTIISLTAINYASAQKLPNVQQMSVRSPAGIKIDGKANEWNNQFQAYNHATDIYYTLSNDNENLYLTVQADIPDIIKRILNGGITLTINTSGKKEDKGAASITYPVSGPGNKVSVNFKALPNAIDSFVNAKNNDLKTKFKTIKVSGIKQLDTLISVYNTDNIKLAEAFDNKLVYTYELAISLNHLEITTDKSTKLAYHIKINEVAQSGISTPNQNASDPLQRMRGISVGPNAVIGQPATDFWGEYTLAK